MVRSVDCVSQGGFRLTRPTLLLAFLLSAHLSADPMPHNPSHEVYEPPKRLVVVFEALLTASRKSGLSPMLLFSMAWAESTLHPDCITWRDGVITARGLVQINPRYQDSLVRRYLPGLNPANFDWRNAEQNALLGALYLADLIKRRGEWGGVCSYSCGESRFLELVKHGRRLPAETETYYKRVLW